MADTKVEVVVLPDGRMDRRNAAAYIGVAEKTMAQWAVKGKGPNFIKRGRCWYRKEVLDAWLNEGEAASTASARLAVVS